MTDRGQTARTSALFSPPYQLGVAAWQLANNLWSFFYLGKHRTDWIAVHEIGLAAARDLHDLHAQARMLSGLATAYVGVRRFAESLDQFRAAHELFRAAGDRWGEGSCLANLADTYLGLHLGLGAYAKALDRLSEGLGLARELRDRHSEALALSCLGLVYHQNRVQYIVDTLRW